MCGRVRYARSWIDNNFRGWASEQGLQTIQNVAAEEAFGPDKVRLQATRMSLSIHMDPDPKEKRWCSTASDAAHPTRSALGGRQLQSLTVRPRERAGYPLPCRELRDPEPLLVIRSLNGTQG